MKNIYVPLNSLTGEWEFGFIFPLEFSFAFAKMELSTN